MADRARTYAIPAVRREWPGNGVAPNTPAGLWIDTFAFDGAGHAYVRGWAFDARAPVAGLTLIDPEGVQHPLDRRIPHPRPDVAATFPAFARAGQFEAAGFTAVVPVAARQGSGEGWVVELRAFDGSVVGHRIGMALNDARLIRDAILQDMRRVAGRALDLLCDQLQPVLTALQQRLAVPVVEEVIAYGDTPGSPEVSVIVPVYGRLDLVEYQLSHFAADPGFHEVDLLYVLDSPGDADDLRTLLPQLHDLYGVSCRLVVLRENAGFSGANNAGATEARGPILLLLNSDVVPARPGWLAELVAFHRATPGIGALGPKLLYEDDSLQHAGMYFSRVPESGEWENRHYCKGLHRSLPAANVTRPVPAVTGACLMIDRSLYLSMGGLSGQYVLGDYEDSDLCLRLAEQGHQHWYLAAVELYHLEAQSHAGAARAPLTRYNRRLHSRHWGERMAAVMRAMPVPSA